MYLSMFLAAFLLKKPLLLKEKSPNKKNDKDTFLMFTIKYNKLTAKYIIIV